MDRLFLLDAYALIYRAYYAFIKSPRINSKGLNTSAILGFVNTLEEVLNKEHPSHIGVAFDPAGPTFPPRSLSRIQSTTGRNTGSHPHRRTYYKRYYTGLPYPHPRSRRI